MSRKIILGVKPNQKKALNAANLPSAVNPFATLLDITAGIGQKAQTMIMSSGTDIFFTAPLFTSFNEWGTFKFEGTSIIGIPSEISLILEKPNASLNPDWGVRIYDVTNAQVICSQLNQPSNIILPKQIFDLGALSNLPAGPAMWELQLIKGPGGQQEIQISSMTIKY
jgi:hypothetical protein